ncbi:AsnC family protein [Sphingomonas azotifigens]|uniref:AsnC family protein n=1 Tax=Sphingomonas azotifigens TaxID=330920 RepID=UPI00248198BD|nr:AsnC family protein [Sphingomonas azotifigens]
MCAAGERRDDPLRPNRLLAPGAPIPSIILHHLVTDGRTSDVALGERVHLSSTATARRRKILE